MRPRGSGSSGRTGPSYSTEPGASTASSSLARRSLASKHATRSQRRCWWSERRSSPRPTTTRRLRASRRSCRCRRPSISGCSTYGRRHYHLLPGTVTIQRHGVHLRPLRQALRRPRRLRGASARRTTRRPRAFPTSCSCAPAGRTSSPSESTHRYPFDFLSSGRPEGAVPRERA